MNGFGFRGARPNLKRPRQELRSVPGPRRGRLGWLRPRRRGQGTARHCLWSPEPLSSWPWSSRPWTTTPLGQPRSDRCLGESQLQTAVLITALQRNIASATPRPTVGQAPTEPHRKARCKPLPSSLFFKGTRPQPDHARRSAKLPPTPAAQANCKLLF